MKYYIHIVGLLIAFSVTNRASAQEFQEGQYFSQYTPPDHYLMSPNATSLGEYGAVPVSLFTGIPEISVPVRELTLGRHTLPISLSYHGGGVRPDQHPGWMGSGWTLNAGGCVSRVVRGLPDETFYHNVDPMTVSLKFGNSFIYRTGYFCESDTIPSELANSVSIYYREEEPDCFMFDFLGYHGKFHYSRNKGWKVESEHPIRVEFDINDESNYWKDRFDGKYDVRGSSFNLTRSRVINNFKLIDGYGNEYYFGGEGNAVEYSVGFFSQDSEQPSPTCWMLTKIRYADGQEIDFKYKKENYTVQLGVGEYFCRVMTSDDGTNSYQPLTTDFYNGYKLSAGTIDQNYGYVSGSLITPSYLDTIKSDLWTVAFSTEESREMPYPLQWIFERHYYRMPSSPSECIYRNFDLNGERNGFGGSGFDDIKYHKLTGIKIYDYNKEERYSYTLSYNDVADNDSLQSTNPRLALISVVDNNSGKRYSFDYNNMDQLPLYCTYNIDHWGFYKETSITRVEQNKLPYVIKKYRNIANDCETMASWRNVDYHKCQYGTLNKVTYPTGGYSRFEFEPNTYICKVDSAHTGLEYFSSPQTGGGIRIRKIYNSPTGLSKDEQLSREYVYDDITANNTRNASSGVLLRTYNYSKVFKHLNDRIPNAFFTIDCIARTSGDVSVFSPYDESVIVGYTNVTEKMLDGSFTVYEFSNFDNGYKDVAGTVGGVVDLKTSLPYSSYSLCRGKLLSRKEYDNASRQVRSRNYSYSFAKDSTVNSTKHSFYLIPFMSRQGAINFIPMELIVYSRSNYKIPYGLMLPKEIVTTEYQDGKAVSSETLKRSYHVGSLPYIEEINYPDGLRRQRYYYYLDNYLQYRDSIRKDNKVALLKSVMNYEVGTNSFRHLTSFERYGYREASPVCPDTVCRGGSDQKIFEKAVMKYDSRYNVVETESDGAPTTVYVWGCRGACPVAKVVNATRAEVETLLGDLEQFSATDVPDYSRLDALRTTMPGALVYTYRYLPLVGLSEMTGPDGVVTRYYYDRAGRLERVTDKDDNIIDIYDYNYAR